MQNQGTLLGCSYMTTVMQVAFYRFLVRYPTVADQIR